MAGNIALKFTPLTRTEQGARQKISLTKIENVGREPQKGSVIGWECAPPQQGYPYMVQLHQGAVLRTSPIQQVREGSGVVIIRTMNSVYQVAYLEEKPT